MFGLKDQVSKLTCSYNGLMDPMKMEFFTGDATTVGDPWSKVAGDRFSASPLATENGVHKSILSISGGIHVFCP